MSRTWVLMVLGALSAGGCSPGAPSRPVAPVVVTAIGYKKVERIRVDGASVGASPLDVASGATTTVELAAGDHVLDADFDGRSASVRFTVVVEKGLGENYVFIKGQPPGVVGG